MHRLPQSLNEGDALAGGKTPVLQQGPRPLPPLPAPACRRGHSRTVPQSAGRRSPSSDRMGRRQSGGGGAPPRAELEKRTATRPAAECRTRPPPLDTGKSWSRRSAAGCLPPPARWSCPPSPTVTPPPRSKGPAARPEVAVSRLGRGPPPTHSLARYPFPLLFMPPWAFAGVVLQRGGFSPSHRAWANCSRFQWFQQSPTALAKTEGHPAHPFPVAQPPAKLALKVAKPPTTPPARADTPGVRGRGTTEGANARRRLPPHPHAPGSPQAAALALRQFLRLVGGSANPQGALIRPQAGTPPFPSPPRPAPTANQLLVRRDPPPEASPKCKKGDHPKAVVFLFRQILRRYFLFRSLTEPCSMSRVRITIFCPR